MDTAAGSTDNEDVFDDARFECRCLGCGYGISTAEPPVSCPMCSGATWMSATAGTPSDIGIERRPDGSVVVAPLGPLDETGRALLRVTAGAFAARGVEVLIDLRELAEHGAVDALLLRELVDLAGEIDASLLATTDAISLDLVYADDV
jgi:hypothetical protein